MCRYSCNVRKCGSLVNVDLSILPVLIGVWLLSSFSSQESDYFTPQGEFRVDKVGSPTLLNCLMYKMSYYRFGEMQVRGSNMFLSSQVFFPPLFFLEVWGQGLRTTLDCGAFWCFIVTNQFQVCSKMRMKLTAAITKGAKHFGAAKEEQAGFKLPCCWWGGETETEEIHDTASRVVQQR